MEDGYRYAQAYIELGNQKFQRKKYAKAMKSYKMAILYDPNVSAAYLNLGLAYQKLGLWDDALIELKEAQKLNPMNKRITESIEMALLGLAQKQKPDDSVEFFKPKGLIEKMRSLLKMKNSH